MESFAIVRDGEEYVLPVPVKLHLGFRGMGMAHDVTHALLRDAVEADLAIFGKQPVDLVQLDREPDPRRRPGLSQHRIQRARQP